MSQLFSCEQVVRNRNGRAYCKVLTDGTRLYHCTACDQFKPLCDMKPDRNRKYTSQCRDCDLKRQHDLRTQNIEHSREWDKQWRRRNKDARRDTEHRYYEKRESRSQKLVKAALRRSRLANVPFDLTTDWCLRKIAAGRCEVTGIEFDLVFRNNSRSPWAPSIDRIEPSRGYVQDNCRVVVWAFNAAKQEWTDAEVLQLAKSIVGSANLRLGSETGSVVSSAPQATPPPRERHDETESGPAH